MPQFPKSFFRKSRGVWYVQIEGKQHNLGPDQKKAFDRYHELMREGESSSGASLGFGCASRKAGPLAFRAY
jgi:hypothetical protein